MASPCLLIGDIGGTNARFAIADSSAAGFSQQRVLRCADFDSVDLAMKAYLEVVGVAAPSAICLAVAGPIAPEGVRITNNHWYIDIAELRKKFRTTAVKLINDFEAIAFSIPLLDASDFVSVGSPARCDLDRENFTIAVVGPGTGFGAVGMCKRKDSLFPIVGEQGHVGFSPETNAQWQVFGELAEEFGRVSNERLLSGPGLENIYRVLNRIDGESGVEFSSADIFARGGDNGDSCAEASLQMFFEALGQVAGDLALSFGAADGLYIAGGIVQRYPQMLVASDFRRGFENKGRQRALMENIPTQLVTHPQPGLLGASFCVLEMTKSGQ